ncbi:zinc ribbon domain-containing protein [Candidatus Nomurabacteria bacterium]|nr:zinc ribbon domain-containing protein [Candidatus Nomurabacteria bacterium]
MNLLKKFFSKEEESDFEEISEKKTSTMGYVLLLLMFFFILIIGNTIISDLKSIPDRPNRPASCLSSLMRTDLGSSSYLKSFRSNTCHFSEIDARFGLDSLLASLQNNFDKLTELNSKLSQIEVQIRDNNSQISKAEKTLDNLAKQYNLSLQEIMAGVPVILDNQNIVQQIQTSRSQLQNFESQGDSLQNQKNSKNEEINQEINQIASSNNFSKLKKAYADANDYYNRKHAIYNFILFLLELIFVLPFFLFALYFYLKLKRKNSPHTIIWTSIFSAASLLFLESVLKFLYHILPFEWLQKIFKFLLEIPALRYIIYYGSVILVIIIFGGIVYYLQKKAFSPKKIALRRLKDNKCPNCSFLLNSDHNFCPKCRQQLKTRCSNCGQARIMYLDYCPSCGSKEAEKAS